MRKAFNMKREKKDIWGNREGKKNNAQQPWLNAGWELWVSMRKSELSRVGYRTEAATSLDEKGSSET